MLSKFKSSNEEVITIINIVIKIAEILTAETTMETVATEESSLTKTIQGENQGEIDEELATMKMIRDSRRTPNEGSVDDMVTWMSHLKIIVTDEGQNTAPWIILGEKNVANLMKIKLRRNQSFFSGDKKSVGVLNQKVSFALTRLRYPNLANTELPFSCYSMSRTQRS